MRVNKVSPFIGKYREIRITYDFDTLSVEADGLTKDDFWENIITQYDVNDPQNYALGIYDAWSTLFKSIHMSVSPDRHVSKEGHMIDEI